MNRRAFTLIELLVVLCCIAILAGLLLPVFASARESARATACLSNLKQIGSAILMYAEDYDGQFPTLGRTVADYGNPQTGDMVTRLQPYIKNFDVWFCPDRTTTYLSDMYGWRINVYSWNPNGRELGYGTNFGLWNIMDNVGMFQGLFAEEGLCGMTAICAVGHSVSEVVSPAEFILSGDTYDFPYFSLSLPYQHTDGDATGGLRHFRHWNYAYADGHVKSVGVGPFAVQGTWQFQFTVMPERVEDIRAMCIDPALVSVFYHVPCGTLADEVVQFRRKL